jgi:hypothetical protein
MSLFVFLWAGGITQTQVILTQTGAPGSVLGVLGKSTWFASVLGHSPNQPVLWLILKRMFNEAGLRRLH